MSHRVSAHLCCTAAAVLIASASAHAQVQWRQCDATLPGRCGTLSVLEDRSRPRGRRIEISFAIVPARGTARREEPVVILLGGPGDAALRRPAQMLRAYGFLNGTRDVIFVDQRGTGTSAPLACTFGSDDDLQSYVAAFLPAREMQACLASLDGKADPARYRTRDFIADLEELRAALGIARWNLYGSSYGTRVALQYMARHPAAIRSAILVAPAPPELVMPVPFGEDAERSLRLLVGDCAADDACATAFPGFARELDSLQRRLDRAPATAWVSHPVTGSRTRLSLSRGAFGEAVRAALYSGLDARMLPLLIHEAYQGDFSGIAAMALRRQRTLGVEGWGGLYLAVTCAEDVPRADAAATVARSRTTILSESRARDHFAACAGWPGDAAGDWPASHRVEAPVLILVGDADPVTPPRWASATARHAPNSRLVVVPQGGHGFAGIRDGGCLTRLQLEFLDAPEPKSLDVSCAASARRLPFVTAR